ncbi:hypothetical protein LIER_23447 [Lithospermum erythrorhizon]|uniref:Uncharacterized protein n=1 Tax=Lithospermum erythrorhizon TaxID=34254 RepID=A0AAV3QXF6_LITER
MKKEFFTTHHHESGGADHHTSPLTTNSPSFHGDADHLTSPLTTFNDHPFSYLALLNSTPSFSAVATRTNYLHLQNIHAQSPQKIINAQILDLEPKNINAHIFEEQKMINNAQSLGQGRTPYCSRWFS